jgi:hypothetical protein
MTPKVLPLIDDDTDSSIRDAVVRPGCGELRTAGGDRLPLKALTVDADIVGLTATSRVRQRFVNDGTTPIEATYIFPLPPRAGVTDFTAILGGRKVVGTLKERGQARMDYEEALEAGQRAAIVEEERSDVFTVRVGNLGPEEEAVVELVLTGPLEVQDGEATFRFPLVIAPRYTTGSPLSGDQTGSGVSRDTTAVPDASRVTPPRFGPGDIRPELGVSVTVDAAGLSLSDFRSSLHTTVFEEPGAAKTEVRLQPGNRADRDFLLRFRLDRSALATSAIVVGDGPDIEEGTWSVTVIPPVGAAIDPRDVVVVLDRSGSMGGWKMVAARRAAGRIVDTLEIGDRFCVLGFDDRIEHPAGCSALVEASDRNRFASASWLGSLEARGGTEMAQPLLEATRLLTNSEAGRRPVLVLVTDGQVTGEDHLLRSLEPELGATTVHCVGVDRAVNAGFLDRLARHGRGSFQLVESEDRLDQVMAELARTIGRPALSEINISGHGIDLVDTSVTPTPIPDAFAGLPYVLSGRYRGALDEQAALTVTGVGTNGPQTVTLVPVRSDATAVRTIWARSALGDMEDAYYAAGRRDMTGAVSRIVDHSIRFGVLSRFTAYVAVDPERTDAYAIDEVVQPVEGPSGWDSIGNRPRGTVPSDEMTLRTLRTRSTRTTRASTIGDTSSSPRGRERGNISGRRDIKRGLELGDVGAAVGHSPDLDLPIEDLDLSERPRTCLKRAQVNTVGQLVHKTEEDLLAITNFGQKSLDEVLQKLDERGLSLRTNEPTSSLGSIDLNENLLSDLLERLRTGLFQTVTDEFVPNLRNAFEAARVTTKKRKLRVALARLCAALDAYISSQGAPTARDLQAITEAIQNVQAVILAHERKLRSKQRFWE